MVLKTVRASALLLVVFLLLSGHHAYPGNNNPQTGPSGWGGQSWAIVPIAGKTIYYEPTIKNIIAADCGRCHSGPTRNLTDYDNLKAYADSGLLATMIQGPMARFAGNDMQTILDWISNGALEKLGTTNANFQPGMIAAAHQQIYYEPTIKDIIAADCGRCHSGPTRNLTDYDNLKAYADSGLLATMIQGPMARFAGNDTQTILDWINNGAPEKAGAAQVNFLTGQGTTGPGCMAGSPYVPDVPLNQMTYTNTIQYVLAKDCLQCHSGQFRNLTTYNNVKMYADNGLLKSLVQMGGPMHRFAGPDSRLIIQWVLNGSPR